MSTLLHPPTPTAASPRLYWHQLYGSAAALALAEAARADRRLYVLIADDARALERLSITAKFLSSSHVERLPPILLPVSSTRRHPHGILTRDRRRGKRSCISPGLTPRLVTTFGCLIV